VSREAEGRPAAFRLLVFLAWTILLALGAWYIQRSLKIGADLRLFLPSPRTAEQRLLLEEVGEGPASRLLLAAIEGAPTAALADTSRALAAALHDDAAIRWVSNGEVSTGVVPERLLPYRYLLSPNIDHQRFDAPALAQVLTARARDLASPAAGLLEPWVPRDPTLEVLALLESWQPPTEPERQYDVWFDRAGQRALLLIETTAAGFDPLGQASALQRVQAAFVRVRSDPAARLVLSGPGAFSVLMQERSSAEAQWFGTLDTIGMVLLLLFAYRSVTPVVLSLLPLATAGVLGLGAVCVVFGQVHGITLAFGFTLIGIAQDYPLHLLSHQRRGLDPLANVRALWPTLATGVASTCIAYLAFLVSGVRGLAQVAVFAIVGLAAAGLSTRYLLPHIIPANLPDRGESAALGRLWRLFARLPRPRLGMAVLAAASVAIILFAPGAPWQDQLGGLMPVPAARLQQYAQLRDELGAPDARYVIVIEAADVDRALTREEALSPALDTLVAAGVMQAYDHAARYVPSRARQLARQRLLPEAADLRRSLGAALVGQPFRADTFAPFLADVAAARGLPPLTPADLAGTPLAARLDSLLLARDTRTVALVTVSGVTDAARLRSAVAAPGVTLLDLKQASEDLVAGQRVHILRSLAVAALLLVLVVWIALRRLERIVRVLAPMVLTTLITVAMLRAAGVSLTLFHLITLVLSAGLGLDYALFFEHAEDDPREQRRTLHAVLVCALSTLMVFALLSLSTIPVLQAIGTTVTIGVIANFVLALLLTRPAPRSGPG
jgi:predicted exporter